MWYHKFLSSNFILLLSVVLQESHIGVKKGKKEKEKKQMKIVMAGIVLWKIRIYVITIILMNAPVLRIFTRPVLYLHKWYLENNDKWMMINWFNELNI